MLTTLAQKLRFIPSLMVCCPIVAVGVATAVWLKAGSVLAYQTICIYLSCSHLSSYDPHQGSFTPKQERWSPCEEVCVVLRSPSEP